MPGGLAAAVLAPGAGCLPEAPPPWQVDHTIAAALRIEVARRGPWGSQTSREDRSVAEAMPGDAIRPAPFVVGPDGPVDAEALAPRYFYCNPQSCVGAASQVGGVRDCEASEPVPPASACEIRGGVLGLGEMTALLQASSIFMVSGTPEGPDASACLERLRGEPDAPEGLQDCLLVIQPIAFGPTWRLLLLAAFNGLADAVPLTEITPDVTAAEPNLFPGEPPLRIRVADPGEPPREQTATRGETIAVRTGAEVEVTAEVDPADAQPYFYVDSTGGFSTATESLTVGWLFSQSVTWAAPDLLSATWTAPDRPGPLFMYALLGDGEAITGTWLRFEVEGP